MTCKNCNQNFQITDQDLKFLDKLSPIIGGKKIPLPPPTLCPDCRQQRRAATCNDINLYKRKTDNTGKDVVSNYHPGTPFKIYGQEYWWSDKWDAMDYGRNFDFNRPFFEQFNELSIAVPRPNVFTGYQYDENCDYTNGAGKNKNCYLIFDADYCRDTYYSYSADHVINCIDLYRARESELCYEVIDSKQIYNSKYVEWAANCTDSAFLHDCYGCQNCFMSFNQQHKKYFLYNRQGTKEEYEALMAQLGSKQNIEKFKKEFEDLKKKYPKKFIHGVQNENVTGDYLVNCKNVYESFDCNDSWDCKHAYQSFGASIKDTMDFNECGDFVELCYECCTGGYNMNKVLFSFYTLDQVSDLIYCGYCHFSSNLFGCIGLKRKKYCILNKQYSKEEYEKLVPEIIKHMQKNWRAHGASAQASALGSRGPQAHEAEPYKQEWGEYFPIKFSQFPYTESLAMDFYPLTKEEALKKGYKWVEEDKNKIPQKYQIPDNIKDVPDTITKEILACTSCKSNFKIIPQELDFYRKNLIPIPTKCFKCRHYARMHKRNPRKLWDSKCGNCQTPIKTTYDPTKNLIVYCEKCYLEDTR